MVTSHPLLPAVPHLVSHPPSLAHGVVPQVKLPKLSIKRFNGDLTKWVTFWDSFNSSIHNNPTLSSVDKFNYLSSLLAAEAIAGLTLTAANYNEAIATLKKRFGNPQLIVNQHMEALLNIAAVTSHHDVKALRKLFDSVEAHIRGLRALGISASAYGGMLPSVLINKLPPEIRLIISREMTGDGWDLDKVMKIIEREVDARERTHHIQDTSKTNSDHSHVVALTQLVNTLSACIGGRVTHPVPVPPTSLPGRRYFARLVGVIRA